MDETQWIPEGIGTAAATGHRIARSRFDFERGRAARRRLVLLCLPMATDGSSRRPDRAEGQTGSGSAAQTARGRILATLRSSSGRSIGLRLSERSVDAQTNPDRYPQGIRCCIPSQSRLATVATCRLVVSSSRASSDPTRRRGHCSLEALQVAAYKKTRNNLGPICCSSMKAASFSFRHVDGHGHQLGRHRSSITTTGTTASPPWRPSVYQPYANTWVYTSGSSRTTFRQPMWPRFSVHSYDICGGRLSYCGTMVVSTKGLSSPNCRRTIPDSTLKRSQVMRPNSIQLSRSGMISRAMTQTHYSATSNIFGSDSTTMHGGSVVRRLNSDHSSWRPTSRRRPGSISITYAKRYNMIRAWAIHYPLEQVLADAQINDVKVIANFVPPGYPYNCDFVPLIGKLGAASSLAHVGV
jgi:hypothetical protein